MTDFDRERYCTYTGNKLDTSVIVHTQEIRVNADKERSSEGEEEERLREGDGGANQTGWSDRHPEAPQGGRSSRVSALRKAYDEEGK